MDQVCRLFGSYVAQMFFALSQRVCGTPAGESLERPTGKALVTLCMCPVCCTGSNKKKATLYYVYIVCYAICDGYTITASTNTATASHLVQISMSDECVENDGSYTRSGYLLVVV